MSHYCAILARVNANTLTFQQFCDALDHAKKHFALLSQKYPRMKAYLVIALLGEQANNLEYLSSILKEFPLLISGGPRVMELRRHLKAMKKKYDNSEEREEWHNLFLRYAEESTYAGDAQFELRFHYLDFDLIRQLQQDELVNQQLTPQTKASIRIVLGSVADFVEA